MHCRYVLIGLVLVAPGLGQERDKDESPEPLLPHGKLTITLDPGMHSSPIARVFFREEGKQLVTVGEDHAIRLWDIAAGRTLKVIHPPGFSGVRAVALQAALAPDGKRLAVTSLYPEKNKVLQVIHIVSLPEGTLERVLLPGISLPAHKRDGSVVFSPDGKYLASVATDHPIRIWNLTREGPPRKIKSSVPYVAGQLAFAPDGRRLARVIDGKPGAIIDVASGKEVARLGGHQVAWSPDGKTIATAGGAGLRLYDAEGKLRQTIPHPGTCQSLVFSRDSQAVLWNGHVLFDLDKAVPKNLVLKGSYTAPSSGDISPDGQVVATVGVNNQSASWLQVYDLTTGQRRLKVLGHGMFPNPDTLVQTPRWSADGLALSWRLPKPGKAKDPDGLLGTFHLGELKIGPTLKPGDTARGRVLEQGGMILKARDDKGKWEVQKEGTTLAKLSGGDLSFATFLTDNRVAAIQGHLEDARIVVFDPTTGKVVNRLAPGYRADYSRHGLNPSPLGPFLATFKQDRELYIWSPDQKQPLLTLYQHGQDWVVWTQEGYYAATPRGERMVGWKLDNGMGKMPAFLPVEHLRKVLYRPDVIKLILKEGTVKKALETANLALRKEGIVVPEGVAQVEKLLPPKAFLRIADKSSLPKLQVAASAMATVKNQPVVAIRLLLDGRPVLAATRDFKPGEPPSADWTIDLPPGTHTLTVLARSPDATGFSESIEVTFAKKEDRPLLHLVPVGISKYQDQSLTLEHAAKDAADVLASFRSAGQSGLFGAGAGRPLVDAQATRVNVLRELTELRKTVKANDLAVIFYAGHAVKEKDSFYLLTVDSKLANLAATALSGADLRKALGEFPCQVLFLLDGCHSAAGIKSLRPATDDFTRTLTDAECGVAVLCATMAHEQAVRGKQGAANGLFAQALREGLMRSERVPYNYRDKRQYIHHLFSFVFDEVKAASDDRQHPFLNLPWAVESFAIRVVATNSK